MTTRIFWLGMHKILIPTELAALRELGYEVFNPPYLSSVRDQSAVLDWKVPPTTLPREVVNRLATYNFFYNTITDEIAELLNQYFDAVVVTINPDWLNSILRVYKKTIIYRTFGQVGRASDGLVSNGANDLIFRRSNFWFVPHCEETAADEHAWLKRRLKVAPYWLTDDVFRLTNKWRDSAPKNGNIGLACPNITNAYYAAHFQYLKAHFEQRHFRYFGVQLEANHDPNVVGGLTREAQLQEFLKLSGFLYTYRERNVCYLPPIEMMVLGAPVLYLPGSLLHRYFGGASPGLVRSERDARKAAQRLISGDKPFIEDIVASQAAVVERYSKPSGLPVLKQAFEEILGNPIVADARQSSVQDSSRENPDKPVLVLGHFDGVYHSVEGEYTCVHGIPRVIRQFVRALTLKGVRVVVSAKQDSLAYTYGFYAAHLSDPELVSVVSTVTLGLEPPKRRSFVERINAGTQRILTKYSAMARIIDIAAKDKQLWRISGVHLFLLVVFFWIIFLHRALRKIARIADDGASRLASNLHAFKQVDGSAWRYIVVPHYYLFPEASRFSDARLLTYVPDYIPHFFSSRGYFPEERKHAAIGKELVRRSQAVLTNSQFSAEYLPTSQLEVPKEKIRCFPLPFLGQHDKDRRLYLKEGALAHLSRGNFVFYPTQAHPNKRLDLLVRSWIEAHTLDKGFDCKLVLTTGTLPPGVWKGVDEAGLKEQVELIPGIGDSSLVWLYKNAGCLAFSSEMEGNFPTQVLEALVLDCPVIVWDNPLIVSVLGDHWRHLQGAPFADTEAFARLMIHAIRHRDEVLASQRKLLPFIEDRFSFTSFSRNVSVLDSEMSTT